MPKKGYKQTKAHIKKVSQAHKKKGRKQKATPVQEAPPAFRDPQCTSYHICLKNAALFDLTLDCTDCQNKSYDAPEPSDDYVEMLTEEAVGCNRLLRAVFHPQAWKLEDRARQNIMKQPQTVVEPQPEAVIEWWG